MNLLPWIFQFVFGCRHRHTSRVFTIKHRTYRVCFDCGREFNLSSQPSPVSKGGTGQSTAQHAIVLWDEKILTPKVKLSPRRPPCDPRFSFQTDSFKATSS